MESHITELHTHIYEKPVPPELLNKIPNVPEVCDAVQRCQLDPLDKSKGSNMLSKTSNMTHANGIDHLSQEIKTTTINMINNSLTINMMVVEDTTTKVINNFLLANTMVI